MTGAKSTMRGVEMPPNQSLHRNGDSLALALSGELGRYADGKRLAVTLILTKTSEQYILQFSDRLVTQSGKPFDELANKAVIYAATNGIVAISYTGASFLDEIPTDQWII